MATGTSGDTLPYAVEREIENIGAVDGSSSLFGFSSAAALTLEAATNALVLRKLPLWEPPYILEGSRPLPPVGNAKTPIELVEAEGRRGDAVESFRVEIMVLPPELISEAVSQLSWPA